MKWHFSKSVKIIRGSWLLAAGITFRHASECRVQAWVTAARVQQGRAVTPPSCGTSLWVLCQQTSSYCLHVCTRNTLFVPATDSSAAPTQEICVWEQTHRTPRKSQIGRRIPLQYWITLLGPRQDELRDQQPLVASFTKERVKPASQTGFLSCGSKPLCWLTHLIKKVQLTDRTFKNQC